MNFKENGYPTFIPKLLSLNIWFKCSIIWIILYTALILNFANIESLTFAPHGAFYPNYRQHVKYIFRIVLKTYLI